MTTTPVQQQSFSLFGGKVYSTPSTGGLRQPSTPSTQTNCTPTRRLGGGGGGGGDGRRNGLPRFKTLAQQTQEDKDEEEEMDDHRRRGIFNRPARGLLSPSKLLSPLGMGSPPPTSTPYGGSSARGGPLVQAFTTPSPSLAAASSAGAFSLAASSVAASLRKRPKSPNIAATLLPATEEIERRIQSASTFATAGSDRDAQRGSPATLQPRQERAWGNTDRGDKEGQRKEASPRPTAHVGVRRGEARTPTSRLCSPRPSKKSPSKSPRGRSGLSQRQPPPPPRRYTLADFSGADEVCFNPGE